MYVLAWPVNEHFWWNCVHPVLARGRCKVEGDHECLSIDVEASVLCPAQVYVCMPNLLT